MFNWLWKVKKLPETPSDVKVQRIIDLLFPPMELHSQPDEHGDEIKFHIDSSIDANLDAVLSDLEDGNNDKACWETLNDSIKRLAKVRHILQAYNDFDPKAKYIIVENSSDTRKNDLISTNDPYKI